MNHTKDGSELFKIFSMETCWDSGMLVPLGVGLGLG